ncbi:MULTISPECIES: carbohydrate binding domain-containing protein [Bacteroides]|jgi:putative carbohydrate binding domain protein|uniref:Carbohydrate binding domain-containing protein n=1 Tax=Bacteroides zhangwenhongii TaxID=2650157 RepID=A0ABT5H562_9BACE|nr:MULTISPECIES: carbohydrate binding domain-containing protein [Bacteroides]MDC7135659.1 carbohydrate binding domain-containing protein [Bacteroides zhangwenhongii]
MKKKYVRIMFLTMVLLTSGVTATYAALPKDDKKETEEVPVDAHLPQLIINGTNKSVSFIVNSTALPGKEIKVTAPNGFTVSPTVLPANKGKQKVTVTLNSTKILTEGKLVLRSGDTRSYVKVKGYGTSLPIKDISKSPTYKGGKDVEFTKSFTPGSKGYTIEFRIKTDDTEQNFYPYFVNEKGYGFKAYFNSSEIGIYNNYQKAINNPATSGKEGGRGKFYNNDGQAHTYRFAITPDNRAFIFRDGAPIDSVRIKDYAPQPNFTAGIGEPVENLLKNPGFEGEFDVDSDSKLTTRIEGWDVIIGDRWNSEQYILPEELDNEQDLDNHVFEIRPYKWATGWSDGILAQVVNVAPNETYTLSALLKGGIAEKEGKLTGKMTIEELQDTEKRVVTEIASKDWETYSMDYTTSPDCKQIRVAFSVGRGGWGNDIGSIRVDNAKLTGVSCVYSPKFGFMDNTAEVEYFTIDESGAYAPAQPEITINIEE